MVTLKRSFLKDVGRALWRSKARFLSIFAMIALGVGFFAGINATRPDMLISADRYYREQRLSDFRILSPLGFRAQDIEALRQTEGVAELAPAYVRDLFLTTEQGVTATVRLYSSGPEGTGSPEFNRLIVEEGRLPERPGEIAVEAGHINVSAEIHLGAVLTPSLPDAADLPETIRSTSFTVVGRVTSPLYVDYQRGQTSIGDGAISWYGYAVPEEFVLGRPTDVYLRLADSDRLEAYSQEYKDRVADVLARLETLGDAVVGGETAELRQELEDGKTELATKKADAERALAEGEQKLRDAEREIADGEAELAANGTRYRQDLADERAKLADGRKKLADGRKSYESGRSKWEKGYAAWQDADAQMKAAKVQLDASRRELEQGEAELAAGRAQLEATGRKIEAGEAELATAKVQLDATRRQLDAGDAEMAAAKAQLDASKRALDQGEAELAAARKTLDAGKAELDAGKAELAAARKTLDEAKQQIDGAKAVLAILKDARASLAEGGFDAADLERLAVKAAALSPEVAALIRALPVSDDPAVAAAAIGSLDRAIAAAEAPLTAAQKEYDAGLAEYEAGEAKIAIAQKEYDAGLAKYKAAESEVAAGRAQYAKGLADYKAGEAGLAAGRAQYEKGVADYEAGRRELAAGRAQYEKGMADLEAAEARTAAGRAQYEKGAAEYDAGRRELDAGKAELDKGRRELDQARKTLAENEAKIEDGAAALAKGERDLERELEDGRVKLADARVELADGQETLVRERADAEHQIADAEREIRDAERAMLNIPDSWFVFGRDSNPGYAGYGDDANRIGSVATVFPLFFFLVAALVCLTTMTRMVEEERLQIGTLKALGYGTFTISSKYLAYALLATLLGAAAGLAIGFRAFPLLIMNAYGMMYDIPHRLTPPHLDYSILSIAIAVTTTVSAALVATLGELRATPAILMQNKAPKPGKRILLERVRPLWRRLSFSSKVTARNIFRYKQRFLMTIIGIAGCTSLLLTGFGLKDSIGAIGGKQFDEIALYDAMVMLDTHAAPESRDLSAILGQNAEVSSYLPVLNETVTVHRQGTTRSYEVTLVVPQDASAIGQYNDLHERVSRRKLALTPDGAVVTEKLAELLGIGAGDSLAWQDSENRTYRVQIAGVSENYLSHYLYLSPELYAKVAFQDPPFNAAVFNLADPANADTKAFRTRLLENEGVQGAMFTSTISELFGDTVSNLNYVVMVLILSAGALAFIVLYNLTNINITERSREIATIKVLGFRDKEVSSYVYRENIALTVIGTLAGIVLGFFMHRYVMSTMEIDNMMFGKNVLPVSYLLSAALTIAFSLLVNLAMYYRLISINMVESLKSVE